MSEIDSLRQWFRLIDLDQPSLAHWDLFLTYVDFLPEITTIEEYDHYVPQMFDASTWSVVASNDAAVIWYHVLLFKMIAFEQASGAPDMIESIFWS